MKIQSSTFYRISAATTLLFGIGMFSACGPVADPSKIEKLVVALEPDRDPDAMLEDRKAFETFLSNALEMPVDVIVPLTASVIHEGLKNGSIDLAYLSSAATAKLKHSADVEILLASAIDGKPSYLSYWLSLKDKPYNSVEDLRGQPIAFSSRTSTSGFLIPVWDLFKAGHISLDDGPVAFFGAGNIHYGVGYVSAVERVLDGSAEAAAVSYYVLEKDKHLSAAQRARLKMVDSQGPVPSHVLVLRSAINPDTKAAIESALISINESAPELRDRLFGAPLMKVDAEAHLTVIREALSVIEEMRF